MNEVYDYRVLRVERGAWSRVGAAVSGPLSDEIQTRGGTVFGLWTGQIGFASDEGVLITAWPNASVLADASADLQRIDGVLQSDAELLVATVRPHDPTPPDSTGVYAHRWFDIVESDWPEFLELSDSAWPTFEAAYPGIRIMGFWRSLDVSPPDARVLLLTFYPTLDDWERSRPYAGDQSPDAQESRRRFMREQQITQRTIVRTTRLWSR